MVSLSTFLYLWFRVTEEIEQEKQRNSLLKGVEGFDLSQLKHTETEEKIVLPSKEGQARVSFSVEVFRLLTTQDFRIKNQKLCFLTLHRFLTPLSTSIWCHFPL